MTGGSWRSKTALTLTASNLLPNTAGPLQQSLAPAVIETLPFGTGPGTLSIIVSGLYTIPAGGTLTLNLFDGSLLDMTGAPATFRELRSYAIWVSSGGDARGLTIGNAGSNPHPLFFGSTTATKTVFPGGSEDGGGNPIGEGVVVTASQCNVKLTNNSAIPLTASVNLGGTQCVSGAPMGGFPCSTYP